MRKILKTISDDVESPVVIPADDLSHNQNFFSQLIVHAINDFVHLDVLLYVPYKHVVLQDDVEYVQPMIMVED